MISGPVLPALGTNPTAAPSVTADDAGLTDFEPFASAPPGKADLDRRNSPVGPTQAQQQDAAGLKAIIRWNRYGTPSSIMPNDGLLASRNGSAVKTAKAWLARNARLFGGAAVIDSLKLVNDAKMTRGSTGHAVLFRQSFGQLTAAVDGLVTLGVNDRGLVYVSSSLSKATASLARDGYALDAIDAWRTAAEEVGISGTPVATSVTRREGFTEFRVDGLVQPQQVRLRALAVSNGQVRPVYETNVVDVQGGKALAYTSFIDAETGRVWVRHNQVDNFAAAEAMSNYSEPFQGAITPTECGPKHGPFPVDDQTENIGVGVNALTPDTDIVVNLIKDGKIVASADLLFSPEVLIYAPSTGVPPGEYFVEVCPFTKGQDQLSGEYIGVFAATEQQLKAPNKAMPAWELFPGNPRLNFSDSEGAGRRSTMCWVKFNVAEDVTCEKRLLLNNPAARLPWDVDPYTFLPTNTTSGNQAITAEAWTSPLTPGAFGQRPLQPDRTYNDEFSDDWNNSKCNPAQLVPGGNDILAATTSLFVGHNRMHDFSWFLGFTEGNFNLQVSNLGNLGAEGDPEVGNTQAGALSGGSPSYLGRDNANQITLQDGVPGITNQYLWQPIRGGFYAPCVDGAYDAGVYAHEYTHAISSRMVAGPDAGLSGAQAGAMGESWSDQVAGEYLFSHDHDTGTHPFTLGPYVTGNTESGIRNYNMARSPLHYGDIGYDIVGPQVHADGEVWSATKYTVRQALVKKYNKKFPYTNKRLQIRCAEGFRGTRSPHGPLSPYKCPGNNRWIALMFDSFLLQQSATSMVDARDAYLAADLLRFNGKNQKTLWDAFASRGFGKTAVSNGTNDSDPKPSYISPLSKEGTLRLKAVTGAGKTVKGELYVGEYEARVTPSADTDRGTQQSSSLQMVPGKYDFVFRANGYGMTRFSASIKAGDTTVKRLELKRNLASFFSGARIDGTSGEGDEAASRNPVFLIDDTELSNWGVETDGNVNETKPLINVNLAGGKQMMRSVNVSALLRPVQAADAGPQNPEELGSVTDDPDSGSRFTAVRQFAIEVCTQSASVDCDGIGPEGYTRIFTSSPKAFNSVAPRPTSPTLLLKSFNVPDTRATHVRLVILQNQCTGQPAYAGEQDNDPLNPTDCNTSSRATIGHVAELQVFG